ncbi:MAG: tRNA pseudouridine(55) synthase TruB [Armatimonadetes bacterium]|nr:tRNA pseudouridine(55) synthase TruB [Armatimonadota bacterium]
MDGVLIVNKPAGCTSHDVVEIVRRRFGIRRVGHAGTLDPQAEGVLVLLLGRATRLAEFVSGHHKKYIARLLLGISTQTQDAEGSITADHSTQHVTEEDLREAAGAFRGPILQIPPMFSAVKVGGKRLHRLARAGQTVERQPRKVTVYSLIVEDFQPGEHARATLCCVVSAGCYIRTLCSDIGDKLGVGGCMESLLRTASGTFALEDAVPLSAIERASSDELRRQLLPSTAAVQEFPRIDVDLCDAEKFCHGGFLERSECDEGLVRVHSHTGELLGVGRFDGESASIRPLKVLRDAPNDSHSQTMPDSD